MGGISDDDGSVEMTAGIATTGNNNGYSANIYPVAPPPPPPRSEAASSINGSSSSSFWTVLRFCNTFAVTILGVLVVDMFVQLQYVQYELAQETDRLDELMDKVTTQQSSQIEQLNQKVEDNHSLTLYQMAGTFCLLTWMLTIFHMTSHLRNYYTPIVQRKICTILWMPPIYGTTAFLSLVFPHADGYLAVISDFYEAYVIYTFLAFLIAVLGRGNRQVVVDVLAQHASHLKAPTRCLQSCYHPPPSTSASAKANAVLLECQVLCMQFVLVRPLTSIARFVATTLLENRERQHQQQAATATATSTASSFSSFNTTASAEESIGDDDYSDSDSSWAYFKSPHFYIAMITNVSVFFAFSGLLKFYHVVNEDLQWLNPFQKFMAIKGIVFLTFWQGLSIAIFVQLHHQKQEQQAGNTMLSDGGSYASSSTSKTAHEEAMEIQNVLLCLEMLFFSIAHWCVFPAEEWEPNYYQRRMQEQAEIGSDHHDDDDDDCTGTATSRSRGGGSGGGGGYRYRRDRSGTPSMGLGDFASDVSYILSSRSRKRQHQQRLSQEDHDDLDLELDADDDPSEEGDDDEDSKINNKII